MIFGLLMLAGSVTSHAQVAFDDPGDSIESVLQETTSDLMEMENQIQAGEYTLPEAWLNAYVDRI